MRSSLGRLFPFLLAAAAWGADWPQFRGPASSGLCGACGPMVAEFGPQTNVLWKTAVPAGKSSPILAGERLFLTGAEGDRLVTLALDRTTGKVSWRRSLQAPKREQQHTLNHRAAPSAVTDGQRVYVFFADFGLAAYGVDGAPLWQLPMGPFNSLHGVAASPVYAGGKVLLVVDQDTDAFIMAVDAATGRVAWKKPREVSNGYSTPAVYKPARGPAQVIAAGSYQLTAYSVEDGATVWYAGGLTCQPKSVPVVAGDTVYFNGWTPGNDAGQQVELPVFAAVLAKTDANGDGRLAQEELPQPWQPTGTWKAIDLDRDGFLNEREWMLFRSRRASRNGVLAVKLGGEGDVTASHVLWRYEKALPDVPAPLIWNGVVYLVRSGGIATTLDARTGKVLKQGRLSGAMEDYYSSPVGVDGKVYVASEHGKMVVLRAAGEWEILAVNDFDAEIYATPAVAEGVMYVRAGGMLYAVGAQRAK